MRTDALIHALAADNASRAQPVGRRVRWMLLPGLVVAVLLFLAILGPRPDVAAAAETVRFLLKFVVTLALAAAALPLAVRLSAPGARAPLAALLIAPAILLLAVAVELIVLPPSRWMPSLVGHNWLVCILCIPLLSMAPLAALLLALRSGAPTAPVLTGAVAGMAAGAIGATLYAAHCPDDSPLFIATWYVIAVLAVTALGAAAGSRLLKW